MISRIKNRLFGGEAGGVFRGMATLALGTGAARIIGVAAIPLLTRIYSPEDFGVLAVFTALVSILVPILTLRYVVAVPLPRHDGMAMNLMALSAGLMFVIASLITLMLWIGGPALFAVFSMEVLAGYWWLIAIGLVGAGGYEMLTMWATRRRAYKPIAKTQIFQSALGSIVKVALGLLALKPIGLLLGQVVTQSAGMGVLGRNFGSELRHNLRFISRRRIWLSVKRYRAFPIYKVPATSLYFLSAQIPIFMCAAYYSTEETGQLALAMTALSLPASIISQSAGKAYYAEISSIGASGIIKIYEITKKVYFKFFLLGIFPAIAIMLFGEVAFEAIFGSDWMLAGSMVGLLSMYLPAQLAAAPIISALDVMDKQYFAIFIHLTRVIFVWMVFFLAANGERDVESALFFYAIVLGAHYMLIAALILKVMKRGTLK